VTSGRSWRPRGAAISCVPASLRRRRAAAVCFAFAALLLPVLALGAEADTRDVRLVPTGLEPVVGPGAGRDTPSELTLRVAVENAGTGSISGVRVVVELFDRVRTRNGLHLALDENRPQTRLRASTIVDAAAGGQIRAGTLVPVDVVLPTAGMPWRDGVHPVRITALEGREPVAEVTTAVIYLETSPQTRLPTVVGWPLAAAPAVDDRSRTELGAALERGGRLDLLVRALERNPRARVQPLVAPHLVEDLAELTDGAALVERIRGALADHPVAPVAAPYAGADLAALAHRGLATEALRLVTEGQHRTEELVGVRPEPTALWAPGLLSENVVREVLAPAGIRTLMLAWSDVADRDARPDRTPDAVLRLGAARSVLVPDPWLEAALARSSAPFGPAVAVQRILAETAMIHFERPFATDRALVLLPPPLWEPPPGMPDGLLAGLARAPWLDLAGVTADSLPAGRDPAQLAGSERAALDDRLASDLRTARRLLTALEDALVDPEPGIGGRTWEELDRLVLRSTSAWTEGSAAARRLMAEVSAAVEAGVGKVTLPADARVTLTDAEGILPVTLSRSDGPPLRVTVALDAPPRLELPDGSTLDVVLTDRTTVSFRAVAHATGRIPVTVRVLLPDGGPGAPIVLAEETLVVRSTAVSRTALALLAGLTLGLLLVAWIRGRRPARQELSVVEDEAA
jgi:hypothetical protein